MKKILIICILSLVTNSCIKTERTPFGLDFNQKRKKIGLELLNENFNGLMVVKPKNFNKVKISRAVWDRKGISLFEGIKKPTYLEKTTYYSPLKNKILFEEDIYASGLVKADLDEERISELIICRYVFDSPNIKLFPVLTYKPDGYLFHGQAEFKNKWEFIYVYPLKLDNITSNVPGKLFYEQKLEYISEQKANRILKSWGLKRPKKMQ